MRSPWLDGLRVTLSSYVVARHLYQDRSIFYEQGWACVDTFFILSGFVLYSQFIRAFNNGITTKIDFIRRRILRIFPFLIIAIFARFVFACLEFINEIKTGDFGKSPAFSENFPLDYVFSLLMVQWIYPATIMLLVPLWSLSVEFYLNVVQLLFGLRFTFLRILFLILLGATFVICLAPADMANLDWQNRNTWLVGFGRACLGFSLGLALNGFLNRKSTYKYTPMILVVFIPTMTYLSWKYAEDYPLFYLDFISLMLIAVLSRLPASSGELRVTKLLTVFGKLSYGVYLIHPMVISLALMYPIEPNIGIFLLVLSSSFGTAFIISRFVLPKVEYWVRFTLLKEVP